MFPTSNLCFKVNFVSKLCFQVKYYQIKPPWACCDYYFESIFTAVGADEVAGSTIVVGGDGRYFSKEAIEKIIQIAAGNRVRKLIIGQSKSCVT